MIFKKYILFVLTFIVVSTLFTDSVSAQEDQPETLTISFKGAVVGPGKTSGEQWDGFGTVSPSAMALVSALVTGGTDLGISGQGLASLVNAFGAGTSAPDVAGSVKVIGGTTAPLTKVAGVYMSLSNPKSTADSYTPAFDLTYENWPVFETTRFEVRLTDFDIENHDAIGTVQLSRDDLRAALSYGKISVINVSDQSSGQIIAIKISVTAGSTTGAPRLIGYRW